MAKATFGAGCFWAPEYKFGKLDGVVRTEVGYAGGAVERPTYQQVCTGRTGHVEVVQLEYAPDRIGYEALVRFFFDIHDPTTRNRQGEDFGEQYRSAIFWHDEEQRRIAERVKADLDAARFGGRIVTEILPLRQYWPAEEYHQKYVDKHGPGVCAL